MSTPEELTPDKEAIETWWKSAPIQILDTDPHPCIYFGKRAHQWGAQNEMRLCLELIANMGHPDCPELAKWLPGRSHFSRPFFHPPESLVLETWKLASTSAEHLSDFGAVKANFCRKMAWYGANSELFLILGALSSGPYAHFSHSYGIPELLIAKRRPQFALG